MKHYIFKLKYIILIKIVAALISIIGIASMPYILKLLFDYDFSKGITGIVVLILTYACAIVVGMLFEYISQRHAWKLEQRFNLFVKQDLFDSSLRKNVVNFQKFDVSEYISIFNNDIRTCQQYVESIVAIIQTVLQLCVYGFFLFTLDYRLAIIIILSSSLSLILPRMTGKRLAQKKGDHLSAMASYVDTLFDLLSGFKLVNDETRSSISQRQNKALTDTEGKLYEFGKFKTFANVLSGSSMYFLELIVFAAIGVMLFKQNITLGIAVAALGYIQSFCYPMAYLLTEMNNVNASRDAKDKLMSIINEQIDHRPVIQDFQSTITFVNVSVTLGDFTLRNFSYEFEKGKKYAIVGPSGVGKSTILNLLMQYIYPDSGAILLDGKSIKEMDTSKIMDCVNQFEHSFHATCMENATVFGAHPETSVVNTLHYFNNDKMYSISTKENARELSGGEKQMLQLLRIAAWDKDILLFDESFSAIDHENATKLQHDLLLKDKTILCITHNVSSENLNDFDEIVTISAYSSSATK
ncbi:ATP-binding cassette domain-containing protein [Paenibacillus guangzhouensis]|uniref:ATP-binding cassette domain-containing protein n=1 Tax=Paenibacillus guangzhouensis TaxID=1473112 RepID=UPI0012670145|nr:ABC transporter ATP-binding protein [Paenibacillus guangzhouensis]